VCDKWTRGGTAVLRLEHRRLDLGESTPVETVAQCADHTGAGAYRFTGLRAQDQIDIPLPNPGFLVQVLVGDREGPQRLGRDSPLVGENGQLPPAGGDYLAADENVITDVDGGLPVGKRVLADLVQAQHRLQFGSVALLQSRETELARIA
jgi:hypothetical protein